MLLPTKGVSAERAIISVGAEVLEQLQSPKSVTALWEQYTAQQHESDASGHVTFDWFALTLASLFAINLVESTSTGYLRRVSVS